jgi:2-C-methyl-D-erythritol 4-phosphate cytidylyltransferase
MTTAAIIAAAGRGERLGPGPPKALRLLDGVPLLAHAARAMAGAHRVDLLVAVLPGDAVAAGDALLRETGLPIGWRVLAGGAERRQSIALALHALPTDVDVVLVHDAARPLAPSALADAVLAVVRSRADAAIPVVPVADTIKRICSDGLVMQTVDRATLGAAQTPQGFRRAALAQAHALDAAAAGTDDAALVEALGVEVRTLPGHPDAFKITTPLDLRLAEAVLAERRCPGVG